MECERGKDFIRRLKRLSKEMGEAPVGVMTGTADIGCLERLSREVDEPPFNSISVCVKGCRTEAWRLGR